MSNFFSSIYGNLGIKLSIALAVLFILVLVLIFIFISDKKFKKRTKRKTGTKNHLRKIKDKKIKMSVQEQLIFLDKRVKEFFKTNENKKLTYTEIIKELKQKNNIAPISFCKKMNYYLYSGKNITEKDVKNLEHQFEKITNKEKPKKELNKKTKLTKKTKLKKPKKDIKQVLKKLNIIEEELKNLK